MRKLSIIICVCLFSLSLFAQVQVGQNYKIQSKYNSFYFDIDANTAAGAHPVNYGNKVI